MLQVNENDADTEILPAVDGDADTEMLHVNEGDADAEALILFDGDVDAVCVVDAVAPAAQQTPNLHVFALNPVRVRLASLRILLPANSVTSATVAFTPVTPSFKGPPAGTSAKPFGLLR